MTSKDGYAIRLGHLLERHRLKCQWDGCGAEFETSCRTRKYCDRHQKAAQRKATKRGYLRERDRKRAERAKEEP